MSDIVVDSSVISKWFVPEPDSGHAQRVMTETVAAGGRLVVLDLIYVEVTNVIWKKHRQKRITLDEARGSLADLMGFASKLQISWPKNQTTTNLQNPKS